MCPNLIDRHLEGIVNILKTNAVFADNIGLLFGKTGIALFMYLYSRYSGNKEARSFAEDLTDVILGEVGNDISVDYARGLSGFGTGIEFLAQHGFVDPNTDEVLDELDLLLQGLLFHPSHGTDWIGIGNYFAARLSNPANPKDTDIAIRNQTSLGKLVEFLHKPYGTYAEAIGAMTFLSEVFSLSSEQANVSACLNATVTRLETMIDEDIRLGHYPGTFNPLGWAVTLIRVSEKTKEKAYLDKAMAILQNYEEGYRSYLNNDSSGLISGSFKWSVLYHYLGQKLPNNEYVNLSDEWLHNSLNKEVLFATNYYGMPSMGIMDGYAGLGLSLLSHTEGFDWGWLGIIPVYYERGKVSYTI